MSVEETKVESVSVGVVLELDPEDILIPEESNVRPWSSKRGSDEVEVEELGRLGQSIAENGQLQPVVVTPNLNLGGPKYSLVAGRRRTQAVKMYNRGADQPIKLKAIVDEIKQDKKRDEKMFQHALHENVQRKQLNPMDFAQNVKTVRENMGEKGKGHKGTVKVAEFFRVSPARITQSEKLLGLPEDLQALVAAGELSGEGALELLKVKEPEVRKAVFDSARGKQKKDEIPSADDERARQDVVRVLAVGATGPVMGAVDGSDAVVEVPSPRKTKQRKTKTVKTKHIREAVRETTGQNTKRGRTELLEFFRGQLGPTNGFPNGSIHLFCEGLLSWAEGKVSDKKLNVLWDEMVEKAYRGKKEEKVEPKPQKVIKAGAAGKAAPKAASKAAGKTTAKKKTGKSKKK